MIASAKQLNHLVLHDTEHRVIYYVLERINTTPKQRVRFPIKTTQSLKKELTNQSVK